MPQFDIVCFANLVVYSSGFFILAYMLIKYYILGNIARVMKMRKKLVAYTAWVNKAGGRDASKALYNYIIRYYK